jgi:hypothetical protein
MQQKSCMFVALILIAFATGCAHQSVNHLKRVPMVSGGVEQSVPLDYLHFVFTTMDSEEGVQVRGVAYPRTQIIPPWALWIEDIWMEGYLSDDRGHVLARDLRVFASRPLDPERGIPFSFTLRPLEMGRPGRIHVTFGYRMVLSRSASEHTGSVPGVKDVFFASEGAVTRY